MKLIDDSPFALRACVAVLVLVASGLAAGSAFAARADLPDPCAAVPATAVQKALGMKTTPVSAVSTVVNASTCSYSGVKVTVSVGLRALTNPAAPLKTVNVAAVPHGAYSTYAGSTQSQLTFYTGTAASGIYGVVRNYGKITQKSMVKLGKLLAAAMSGSSATASGGLING